ncbi:MAG: Fur family transcriptional regulator [Clostridiaceae bacterium]|nr:Fur family transcriptional regulator [Clostridiaceae bacterium]
MIREFEYLRERLKEKGYKLTPQRRSILSIILETEGSHLSVEEIYDLVKVKCPDIGLATVYRTMQMFEEVGLVYKHNFDEVRSRYELNHHNEYHQHHHLICVRCNKVIEVEEDLLEKLESGIETKYNFEISNHNVKFFGYCEKCRK